MSDKLVVILSSGDGAKVRTGAMYAVNALKRGWLAEVKLFLFGPAEELLLHDEELQRYVAEYRALAEPAVACKFIADRDGTAPGIAALDVEVAYVGQMISDLIKAGYTPMVW